MSPLSPQYATNPSTYSHSRSSSYESLLYTPPLSPTEEQLLAFLIPDIEPSELAAYLSTPSTPILSDVSCLIEKSFSSVSDSTHNNNDNDSFSRATAAAEAVYPSPVCAAAAATVVAVDGLDKKSYPTTLGSCPSYPSYPSSIYNYRFPTDTSSLVRSRKRCSTYAFLSDNEDEEEEDQEEVVNKINKHAFEKTEFLSSPVFVMSSRNTRKRLMLEQAFVSPDEEEVFVTSEQNVEVDIQVAAGQDCYAQLFNGVTSMIAQDCATELSSNLAFDLVLA
ncbi:hypothetical protein BG004_002100 [Podila humilis]|nr:hypothetical protein BG004_002100 [Podila humilis]